MDDVASVQLENENLRKIRSRLLLWDAKNNAFAALNVTQDECLEQINSIWSQEVEVRHRKLKSIEANVTKILFSVALFGAHQH